MNPSPETIRVLHVDGDLDFVEQAAAFIDARAEQLTVEAAGNAPEAIDLLGQAEFDCIVSEYDVQGTEGLGFLETVREDYPNIPFILYTGKGSEEVASDAISAGVADYLPKEPGTGQYHELVDRITEAAEGERSSAAIRETEEWASTLLEHSSDFVLVVDETGIISYVSPSVERVMGYPPEEVAGTSAFEYVHPDDMELAAEALEETLEAPEEDISLEYRTQHANGSTLWLEVRGRNLFDNPVIGGILVNARDITNLIRHRQRLEVMNRVLRHDIRNEVNLILAYADEALDGTADAEDRLKRIKSKARDITELGDQARLLERTQDTEVDLERIELVALVESYLADVRRDYPHVDIETDLPTETYVLAIPLLESAIKNVVENAIEHNDHESPTIHIALSVNESDDRVELRVADNGPGIPVEEQEIIERGGRDPRQTQQWSRPLDRQLDCHRVRRGDSIRGESPAGHNRENFLDRGCRARHLRGP